MEKVGREQQLDLEKQPRKRRTALRKIWFFFYQVLCSTYYLCFVDLTTDSELEDLYRLLPAAADAPFISLAQQHEPLCLLGTRVDLLQDIHEWVIGSDEQYIFWLSGLAGTGKSTIAGRRFFDQKLLGASFFFTRGNADVGRASKFVTSIARQFFDGVPALRRHIADAISDRRDVKSMSFGDQWQIHVINPLKRLQCHRRHTSFLLVIDALDECEDPMDVGLILKFLSDTEALRAAQLRVFLTSRPEVPIRYGFAQMATAEHKDVILHNISRTIVDDDIALFLKDGLDTITRERSLHAGWPGSATIQQMVNLASGLFIWAATACMFIRQGRSSTKRLDLVLAGSLDTTKSPEQHLAKIYTTILDHSISLHEELEDKSEILDMLRQILGGIITLMSPLSVSALSRLLCIPEPEVNETISDLHSVLDIPRDRKKPIRLHHLSL